MDLKKQTLYADTLNYLRRVYTFLGVFSFTKYLRNVTGTKKYEMGAQRRNEKNDRDCSLFRRWREPSCADIPMEPIPTDLEQTDGDGRRYEEDS